MTQPKLFGAAQSIYVRAVRLAFAEKGVAYTLTPANPHSPEVNAIHPFGRIPVLRHGSVELFESRAITTYLDLAFAGPKLLPSSPVEAAYTEQWLSALNTTILPTFTTFSRNHYFPDATPTQSEIATSFTLQMQKQIDVLGRAVQTGAFVAGTFGLADMSLMPILAYLRSIPQSADMLDRAPALDAYFRQHSQRLSWSATDPPAMSALRG